LPSCKKNKKKRNRGARATADPKREQALASTSCKAKKHQAKMPGKEKAGAKPAAAAAPKGGAKPAGKPAAAPAAGKGKKP
jgi:hypothetical protein